MSCGCENKRKASEYDRMRRLAKTFAVMRQHVVELRKSSDGTYSFNSLGENGRGEIVEFIHYL